MMWRNDENRKTKKKPPKKEVFVKNLFNFSLYTNQAYCLQEMND